MRLIKIILISLYVIILGFIVFGNTSVFADTATQIAVFETSNSFDDYFINCQEYFDFCMVNNQHRAGWGYIFNQMTGFYRSWGAYAEPKDDFQNHGRGWLLYVYSNNASMFTSNSQFVTATLPNYWGNGVNMTYKALKMNSSYIAYIYNDGADYIPVTNRNIEFYLPLCCLNYPHTYFQLYKMDSNTSGATTITNAINTQTNSIVNETQKQTNQITGAVTNATQQQTNQLLDTNDTGNETMSVNDTTTDTSADLGGLFNSINSAFTDTTSETQKGFDLQLPNGDTHTFTLKSNVLTSFLDSNPVLKAFYQAFFYVVFGGYVIFDFKKIINKLKEGNIDNVVGSSSPVDSVVNMSLK